MKSGPTIQKYMTTAPHTIGAEQTLEKATHVMNEFRIRHLPVLSGEFSLGWMHSGPLMNFFPQVLKTKKIEMEFKQTMEVL